MICLFIGFWFKFFVTLVSFLLTKDIFPNPNHNKGKMKPFCIFRFRCLFTYQIPLICEIRIGGIFVLLGCYRDGCGWVDGCRQWFLVAALEPTETYLLYGAVNLRKQMLKKMRIKCTIWKHFQLFIEFSEERILPVYVLRRLTSICLKFCDLFTQTSILCDK